MARRAKGLGERHKRILAFLKEYQDREGYPPTIREIGEATGISSTSVVNYYLDQLERMGRIERQRKIIRGVKLNENLETSTSIPESIKLEISRKAFISYAREDLSYAQQIYSLLKDNNISPWLDYFDLIPGQDWDMKIQKEIETSDYIIICLSNHSVTKKGYIQKEIRKALSVLEEFPEGDIYLIPIKLDDCNVPTSLLAKQWLDWNEPDSQKKLLKVFDYPNISSRFSRKKRTLNLQEPRDYVIYSLQEERTMDEIISNLIFKYDLKPSQAEKIYNEGYKDSLA